MNQSELLPIGQALARWLGSGRGGRPISPSTAWRWHTRGSLAADGTRAHLRLTRIGGRIYLRRADLDAFIAACSAAPAAPPPAPVAAPAPAAEATAEVLSRAGITRAKAVQK